MPIPTLLDGLVPSMINFCMLYCRCQVCHKKFLAHRSNIVRGRAQSCSAECRNVKRKGVALPDIMGARIMHRTSNVDLWFWPLVDKSGGKDACWPWLGSERGRGGHGRTRFEGKHASCHRLAYTLTHGNPKGMVCHACNNAICCNPAHLYDGNDLTNAQDRRYFGGYSRISGKNSTRTRLTDPEVIAIRESEESNTALMKRYGLSRTSVQRIRKNQGWIVGVPDANTDTSG